MKLFSILVAGFALVHGQTDDQIDPRGKERVFLENIIFLHKYNFNQFRWNNLPREPKHLKLV